MLETLRGALAAQPLLLLFLTVGLGYLLSLLKIKGIGLGVAAVLFAGLGLGMWGGHSFELPELISQFGLLLFVYAIGVQAGPLFFRILRKSGLGLTLLALVAVGGTGAAAAMAVRLFGISPELGIGLFCGAVTNTPALAAVSESLRGTPGALLPTVGYSIAYPLGVAVPILLAELVLQLGKIDLSKAVKQAERSTGEHHGAPSACNLAVTSEAVIGMALSESPLAALPVRVSRVQRGDAVMVARPNTVLEAGDVLRVVGTAEELAKARQLVGREVEGDAGPEFRRDPVDFRRMILSTPRLVGRRLGEIGLEKRFEAVVTRVRRGDQDFVPTAETVLERGDRLRVVAQRDQMAEIGKYLGDSSRAFSETDFLSLSVGIVLGVLLGLIKFPLPGGGTVHLGLAGGPLVVALVLGWLGRTGPLIWSLPPAANLAFRQLGLVLFFAAVGLRAGGNFAAALADQGPLLIAIGAGLTLLATAILLGGAMAVLRMDWVSAAGALAGGQTQPALLTFADDRSHSEAPNVVYTAIMPTAMIAKILVAQILIWVLDIG
jgi:putative transport protein